MAGGSPPYLLYIINSGVNYAPVLKTLPAAATPGSAYAHQTHSGPMLIFRSR